MHPVRGRLHSRYARGALDCGHIKACGFRERHGKDRAKSVDDIVRKQQWNAETRLLDSDPLQPFRRGGTTDA